MKKVLLFLFIFSALHSFSQTPGEWTWMKGSNTTNSPGSLGTQGISSPANDPRAVYEACEWTDLNGNFWLFGGRTNNYFSDLFKYDPLTNEWTWMKGPGIPSDPGVYGLQGVSSLGNYPPARGMGTATWTDQQNNLWMFAGASLLGGYNDLWKYDISTNEWTWMSGSNSVYQYGVYGTQGIPSIFNIPGSRWETTANWTDVNGDLWLFGGYNQIGNINFNDLWRYTISTGEWTWMKGSFGVNQLGVYGAIGIEASANSPGARAAYSNWIDGSGNFWLFGGLFYDSVTSFNDMWKYNVSTNNWTWITGGNVGNEPGYFNQTCDTSILNAPQSRYESRAEWKDHRGNFWLFSGFFSGSNDLWMFCFASKQWIFINSAVQHWGIQGVSSPLNSPGTRPASNGWLDNNGNIYMYGGALSNYYNDVWRYVIDTSCGVCFSVPSANFSAANSLCPGTCTDFLNLSFNATSYQWNFPGATPDTSTATNPTNICYYNSGSYDVQLIATNANGSDTLLLSNYITVYPAPAAQGISQSGDTLFANAGANSYQWYYNTTLISGATDYFYVAPTSGDYNVVCTDSNGCEVEAAVFNVIAAAPPGLPEGEEVTATPNPVSEKLEIKIPLTLLSKFEKATITIYNMLGEKVLAVSPLSFGVGQGGEADVSALPPAMYYLEVVSGTKIFRTKLIKQ